MEPDRTKRLARKTPEPVEPTPIAAKMEECLGRYRLGAEIASGGMATVYLALLEGAAGFEKVVACKVVHPHLAKENSFIEMFLDEARIASRIHHPNVCPVFDFGESDGRYYLAMEYLLGHTLGRVLRHSIGSGANESYLPNLARIVADACEGLHAAHELTDAQGVALDVVHRDVSPHNIFVTFSGVGRVMDFGIAKAKDRVHKTSSGEVKGSFGYISPEQLRGARVDRRADIWSLGVLLWEACTTRRLFKRESRTETLMAVAHGEIPRAADVTDLPPALDELIATCLDRSPENRPETARALGRELVKIVGESHGHASAADVAEWMQTLFPGEKEEQQRRVARPMRAARPIAPTPSAPAPVAAGTAAPRSKIAIGIALVVLVAGGLLAYQSTRGDPNDVDPNDVAVVTHEPRVRIESEEPAPMRESQPSEMAAIPMVQVSSMTAPPARMTTRRRRSRGTVRVNTFPAWSAVYERGRHLGNTPLTVQLREGRHVLELRPLNRTPGVRRIVNVRGGEESVVSVELASPSGS